MNFWTGKQDDKEFEKERNRILKEWNELHQKRVLQELKDRENWKPKSITSHREGWDY